MSSSEASSGSDTESNESDTSAQAPNDSEEEFRSRTEGSGFDEPGAGGFFVEGERAYNNTSWTYRLPADQEESLRQDHQHHLLSQELPGLYRGPVEAILTTPGRLKRILDVGCGTGIWLAEMAELFPNVDCVGIDIMPSQHDHQHRNCTFMFVEAPLGMAIFPDASFDLVQIRQMLFAVTDYRGILDEAYRILRPGGILLLHECSMIMESSWPGRGIEDIAPATTRWWAALWRALEAREIDLDLFGNMQDAVASAGFDIDSIDSYEYARQFCTESYPGQIDHTLSFVGATRLLLVEGGEMGFDDFDETLEQMSTELRSDDYSTEYLYGRWAYWWVVKD